MNRSHKITAYLNKLGFDKDVAKIYLSLEESSPQSISEISRNSGVERTRVYRLLDILKKSGLIEERAAHKRSLYGALPLSNIEVYLDNQENELNEHRKELSVIKGLSPFKQMSNKLTGVRLYNGSDGIKQMQWNLLSSKSIICSTMNHPMFNVAGGAFFKRWAERWNNSDLQVKLLYNKTFLNESNEWHEKNEGYTVRGHNSRLLGEGVYKIKFCVDVYDNVVAFYNWEGGEVYGMEIINQEIADSQKFLFNNLWERSKLSPNDSGIKHPYHRL